MELRADAKLYIESQYHIHKDPELIARSYKEDLLDSSYASVASFITSFLGAGEFEINTLVIAVIFLSRFRETSSVSLHVCNWRLLLITALLLADKAWQDSPVKSSAICGIFPILTIKELNILESHFLRSIKYHTLIRNHVFSTFREKLLKEDINREIRTIVSRSLFMRKICKDIAGDFKTKTKPRVSEPITLFKPPTIENQKLIPTTYLPGVPDRILASRPSTPRVSRPSTPHVSRPSTPLVSGIRPQYIQSNADETQTNADQVEPILKTFRFSNASDRLVIPSLLNPVDASKKFDNIPSWMRRRDENRAPISLGVLRSGSIEPFKRTDVFRNKSRGNGGGTLRSLTPVGSHRI